MSTTDPHNIPYVAQLVEPEGVRETDAPRKKPKFVYFLAVANLLYAGAGAFFLGDKAVNSLLAWWDGQTLALEFFTLASTVSGLFGAVLLVIGSIGLFRFHPIGRSASLWYVRISLRQQRCSSRTCF